MASGGLLDVMLPDYVGAPARIKLVPADIEPARAFASVRLLVELQKEALTLGLALPLEMTVTAPSAVNFFRHIFRLTVPSEISFTPKEGGQHLVRLREVGHNKWHGELVIDVAGERTSK
jgi:hypothetical protein